MAVPDEHRAVCQVCGDELDEPIVRCPVCDTPHHQDCWEYNEGCSIFGCKAALSTARKAPEPHGPIIVIGDGDPVSHRGPAPLLPTNWTDGLPPWLQENLTFALTLGGGTGLLLGIQFIRWASRGSSWLGFFGGGVAFLSVLALLLAMASAGILANSAEGALSRPSLQPTAEPTVEDMEARLAENPRNFILLEQLAFEVFGQGDLKKARGLYERAVALRPLMSQPHYYLGRVLAAMGEDEKALEHLKFAMDERSRSPVCQKARWWYELVKKRRR